MATKKGNGKKANGSEPQTFKQWEAGLTVQERRIEEIVQMMAQNEWLPRVSERELAKKWNVTPSTVRNISAEANRQLRKMLREDETMREETRAELIQTFRVIQKKGFECFDPQGLRVALEATKALGLYMGLEPPKQVELGGPDAFEDMSDEELDKFIDTGKRANRKAIKRLGANGSGNGSGGTRH